MVNVSIIIPIYNMEQFLARCLDSVVAQGVSPHEVIMVNDGSTDGSREIALRYVAEYPYMRYIEQPNGGVSVARNTGMKEATGEYITFCDPDDYYEPHFMSELTSVVERCKADLYRFGFREIGREEMFMTPPEKKRWSGAVTRYSGEEYLQGKVMDGGMMPWRFLFRRDMIERYGVTFPPGIVVNEDEVFCLRYSRHIATMVDIDSSWYVYFRHESSAVAQTYGSFNHKAVASFKANALTLLSEWGADAPATVGDCIEGCLFSFTKSYISLPRLSGERLAEVREGIKEIRDEMKRNGISLSEEWRYEFMYRAFRLYRWMFRTKKRVQRWVFSKE